MHMRMPRFTKKRLRYGMKSILSGKILSSDNKFYFFNFKLQLFPEKLNSRWFRPFTITQVFPYEGDEVMHLEKGTFKVNGQRLKPYLGGDFNASKASINLEPP